MTNEVDEIALYNRLPYTTTVPSSCHDVERIDLVCASDRDYLQTLLAGTPFTATDDRFTVAVSDRRKSSATPLVDFTIAIPVEYNGTKGSYPIVVVETSQRMVYGGREKWGYNKVFGDIEYVSTEDKTDISVTADNMEVASISWQSNGDLPEYSRTPPVTLPHLLVKTETKHDSPGIASATVLSRDVGTDFEARSVEFGTAQMRLNNFGPAHIQGNFAGIEGGLANMQFEKVEFSKRVTGDWFSTEQNGWARQLARLI